MDRDTHGSAACEVQHIVDLFLDYNPWLCLARKSSIRARLSSREPRSCVRRDRRDATRCWMSSAFVAVRSSLTTRGRIGKCLVDGKKAKLGNPAAHDGSAWMELLQKSPTARNFLLCEFHSWKSIYRISNREH